MNTYKINCALTSLEETADTFLTCIPKDFLVDQIDEIRDRLALHKASALVVNTDSSNGPGEHWIAIYIDENGHCEWFDSYGFRPEFYDNRFISFFNHFTNSVWCNNFMFQSMSSDVCGEYAIIYIFLRCIQLSPTNIINIFEFRSHSSIHNDQSVVDAVWSLSHAQQLPGRCIRSPAHIQISKPRQLIYHMR